VLDADDVLLYRKNEYPEDYTTLQKDINSITERYLSHLQCVKGKDMLISS